MLNIRKLCFEFYYFVNPWKDGGKIRESAKANCPETVGEVKGEAGEVKATEDKEGTRSPMSEWKGRILGFDMERLVRAHVYLAFKIDKTD